MSGVPVICWSQSGTNKTQTWPHLHSTPLWGPTRCLSGTASRQLHETYSRTYYSVSSPLKFPREFAEILDYMSKLWLVVFARDVRLSEPIGDKKPTGSRGHLPLRLLSYSCCRWQETLQSGFPWYATAPLWVDSMRPSYVTVFPFWINILFNNIYRWYIRTYLLYFRSYYGKCRKYYLR